MSTTKKSKFPLKWLFLILGVCLLAVLAYYFLKPKETAPTYLTADVVVGDIEESVMASGKVKASKSVNVGSQVSGEVKKLYVKLGDVVQAGDMIADIDSTTQANNLSNAQANLAQTQASLQTAHAGLANRQGEVQSAMATLAVREAELKKATAQVERLTPLIEINAISQKEFADANAELNVATANVKSAQIALQNAKNSIASAEAEIVTAQANIAKSQNDFSTAKQNLSHTTIKAPIAGTVVAVTTEQGSTVNTNSATPTIVTLADLSRVRINTQISEADIVNLQAGMKAKFNIIGNPNQKFDAVLTGINPAPEAISTSNNTTSAVYYIGYLDVDNADGKFRIDMTAQVNIIINEAKGVLTIPASAIKDEQGKTTVQVLGADGKATTVPVQVGINNRVTAEIKSGLNAGDKVIIGESRGDKGDDNARRPPRM